MRVLFINPITPPNILQVRVSLGVASLSAVLKRAGHNTSLLCPYKFDPVEITSKIDEFKPHLIAFSSVSDQFPLTKEIIEYIKLMYDNQIPIIIGGIHATVAPNECLEVPGVMGVCVGEGDEALLELVTRLDNRQDYIDVKNFWFNIPNGDVINPPRPLIKDLDSLPFPDRDIFEPYLAENDQIIEFMASRGCPYLCRYCINHVNQKIYGAAGYLRVRSVDNFIREIKNVVIRYAMKHNGNVPKRLEFHDDTFTLHKAWLKEFCEKYEKEVHMPFVCNARVETINEETILMLKKAGCCELKVGIESGNERIRKEVLNRHMTNEQIINCFELCKKHKLNTSSFNIIGIPGESEEELLDTIKLNQQLRPTVVGVSIFQPYKGTELYHVCKENGWISDRKAVSFYQGVSILDLPTIPREKVEYYYKVFKTLVYHPELITFVDWAIKLRLYYPIKRSYEFSRKIAGKMLSPSIKRFIRRQ